MFLMKMNKLQPIYVLLRQIIVLFFQYLSIDYEMTKHILFYRDYKPTI